jgi:hypothetical protein
MSEFDVGQLVHMVRAILEEAIEKKTNPPPVVSALIEYYVPTVDVCPHCGAHRKEGVDWGGRGWQHRNPDPLIKVYWRTIKGKSTVLLGRKICTDK